jgi:hypothetical protein
MFANLCNQRNIRIAVEVGTDQGVYAKQFMNLYQGDHLFCIDPYVAYEWLGIDDRLPDMLMAVSNLASFDGRARIVRGYSPNVIPGMPPWARKHLGFVYVDGSHERLDVEMDIEAWWETLTPNGILAGHDYDVTHPGVIAAVDAFAERVDHTVRLTTEAKGIPSWYIYKTELGPNEPEWV